MESRYTDLTLVECENCGWIGQVKDTIHTYEIVSPGQEVAPVDECPKCGSPNLINIKQQPSYV